MIFYQNKQILGNFLTIFYVLDLASPCCGVASKGRKPLVVHIRRGCQFDITLDGGFIVYVTSFNRRYGIW
jgi:hypothetical protein